MYEEENKLHPHFLQGRRFKKYQQIYFLDELHVTTVLFTSIN
jgi:hypothetical protein